jgi:hypothetical protein
MQSPQLSRTKQWENFTRFEELDLPTKYEDIHMIDGKRTKEMIIDKITYSSPTEEDVKRILAMVKEPE